VVNPEGKLAARRKSSKVNEINCNERVFALFAVVVTRASTTEGGNQNKACAA
jgi:hypothetical protein